MKELEEIKIQLKQIFKTLSKYGKTQESIEKDVAQLKVDSHPPLFKEDAYIDLMKKFSKLEDKLIKKKGNHNV